MQTEEIILDFFFLEKDEVFLKDGRGLCSDDFVDDIVGERLVYCWRLWSSC